MFKSSKPINVVVTSVDSKLEFGLLKSSSGKQLFDQVAKTLAIREIWYFGIQYVDKDGEFNWLKLDKKISSQVELKAKDKDKNCEFFFRVKYFPEDVLEELIEDVTKEFFFLQVFLSSFIHVSQVRSSILNGIIYCPAETAVLLASYYCQVRLGDSSEDKFTRIPIIDKLLPKEVIEKHNLSNDEWISRITHCYKTHAGMSKEDAIMEYLKICQDLEMYGVNYFPIKNKKGTDLLLGIDSMGLNIYERDDKLTPKIGFPWGEVKHISYSGRKFTLKPTDKTAKEWHFLVDRVRINRNVLALSIGNHELYMRRRNPESIEVQQMRKKANELKEERIRQREESRAEIEALKREVEQSKVQFREEAKLMINRYEGQMEELNQALQQERECRLELENMQEELRNMNIRLEEQFTTTAEEKQRLLEERNEQETRVREHQFALEEQQRRNNELSKQLSEAEALASNANSGDIEINNNNDDSEKDDDARELQVMENYSRREESRDTEISRNAKLQLQLNKLREDLNSSRQEVRLTQIDKRYENNQRKGLDKFKTLREIRKGNTKKRVDEFEAM